MNQHVPIAKTAPPPALIEFVLGQLRVKTNVCTLQDFHDGGFRVNPRTVPDHNLIYVAQGRPKWIIEGEEVPLRPRDLLIVPPGVKHHAVSMTHRVLLASIHVEVTLPAGQDVLAMLAPPRVQRLETDSRLERYWRGVLEEWPGRERREAHLRLRSWARLIVIELLADNAARGLLAYQPVDPLITRILDELQRRIDEAPSLDNLASRSGYSPQHLNRLFNKVLGMTPLQYLAKLRMERAAALIAEGKLTIRGVAERLGFDDPYYFSRAFKQHFGQSPAQYRAGDESRGPAEA